MSERDNFMQAATRCFRYGTCLTPSVVKNIINALPEHLKPLPPGDYTGTAKETFLRNLFTTDRRNGNAKARYPSVSAVVGATDDQERLHQWQTRQCQEMGMAAFKISSTERMKSGTNFHKVIKDLLDVLKQTGSIEQSVIDEIFKDKVKDENRGYIHGIIPFLKNLNPVDWMATEQKTVNHYYCYQGRFDAIIELNGEPTLVDWKTVSAKSVKSTSDDSMTLADLYSNPIQVAAYIASVNTDPSFEHLPTITQGAVVLAFEDGRAAQAVLLRGDELRDYLGRLGERLNNFWWKMEHPKPEDFDSLKQIDFVYNPALKKKPEVVGIDDDAASNEDEVQFLGVVAGKK